jgi:hypothetical protein
MDYRGPDLDLRTSRWSAASTDPSGWREANMPPAPQPAPVPPARQPSQRSSPIWVDETLLACANHAYDVALAYRSAEVRLEHLLLAMTRVEPAAVALEARGVRVASLRRDCAVAIAGDPPAAGTDGATPRRSPELEDVLRLAASRAAHTGRAAGIDDVVQALGEVGGDRPGGDLVVRHFPRSRDFWGSLGPSRSSAHGNPYLDLSDSDRPLTPGGPMAAPGVDQAVVQRLFERLSDMERGFADRLAALEAAVARQSAPAHADLSPLDSRLSAIESALHARANGDAGLAFDAGYADRLATIEAALATERSERASAITALSDEISGVRSAVRLAAQNSEAAQSALAEQLQLIASSLDQSRDAGGSFSDRIAAIEQALEAQGQRLSEAQAVYSAELTEVHEALMKIGANHQTLAGAIDNWRSNDSGEIHLINARIGAVHEDGSKRLAAIEKLCADVETLSHLVLDDRTRQQGSFKRWLLGTEDWVKASWRPPAIPRPSISRPKWTRVSWKLPFSKRRNGISTNG